MVEHNTLGYLRLTAKCSEKSNDPNSPPRRRAKNILRIDESSKPSNSEIMNIREKSES